MRSGSRQERTRVPAGKLRIMTWGVCRSGFPGHCHPRISQDRAECSPVTPTHSCGVHPGPFPFGAPARSLRITPFLASDAPGGRYCAAYPGGIRRTCIPCGLQLGPAPRDETRALAVRPLRAVSRCPLCFAGAPGCYRAAPRSSGGSLRVVRPDSRPYGPLACPALRILRRPSLAGGALCSVRVNGGPFVARFRRSRSSLPVWDAARRADRVSLAASVPSGSVAAMA